MSFQQGLSGLNAAARNLDVIGNNVANTNTVGFKQSHAQFADLPLTRLIPLRLPRTEVETVLRAGPLLPDELVKAKRAEEAAAAAPHNPL